MPATTLPSMAAGWRLPNVWDAVAFLCVIGALVGVGAVLMAAGSGLLCAYAVCVVLVIGYAWCHLRLVQR